MQSWEATELIPVSVFWKTDLPVNIAVISLENDQPLKKIVSPAVKDPHSRFSGAASFLVDASLLIPQPQLPSQQQQSPKQQGYRRLLLDLYSSATPLHSKSVGRATISLEGNVASHLVKGSYDVVQPSGVAGRQSTTRGIAHVHVRAGKAFPLPRRGQPEYARLANVQSIMNPARFALPYATPPATSQGRRNASHMLMRTRNDRSVLGVSNSAPDRSLAHPHQYRSNAVSQEPTISAKENVPPVVVIRNPDGTLEDLGFLVVAM
ncbi:hypothetical protein CLOM_g15274 [Closterium sp. NIES-68]|nr:hypothetical protein CLOM_g15274 [Closterium sp. NIES-68]GJP86977.1 hypothetical protein CLOP_g16951 [Closterium sp. NIES-67]